MSLCFAKKVWPRLLDATGKNRWRMLERIVRVSRVAPEDNESGIDMAIC